MQDFWTINSSDPITVATEVEFTAKLMPPVTRIFQELSIHPLKFYMEPQKQMHSKNVVFFFPRAHFFSGSMLTSTAKVTAESNVFKHKFFQHGHVPTHTTMSDHT